MRRTPCPLGFVLLCLLALAPAMVAAEQPRTFYVEDIKGAMGRHIASRVDEDGIFRIRDDVTGEMLSLEFVKIHDPVRVIDDETYFACTDFRVVGKPKKLYDLDFWLRPAGDVLEVYEERVHKEPRRSLLWGWYKHPRYTFVDDEVVSLY
jgi:hypothetical protein